MDTRILDIARTATLRRGEKIETDHSVDGSGKLDLGDFIATRNALQTAGAICLTGYPGGIRATLTGQNIGTNTCSVSVKVKIPTAFEAPAMLWALVPTNAAIGQPYTLRANFEPANGGTFRIVIAGAANTDYLINDFYNFCTNYAGKEILLTVVRGASGDPVVYVDNAAITKDNTLSNGTVPTWQATITSMYLIIGTYDFSVYQWTSTMSKLTLWSLALSQADVRAVHELGGAVPFYLQWGSLVAKHESDFSAGADNHGSDYAVLTGNIDTAADGVGTPPSDNWLRARTDATEQLYTYSGGFYRPLTEKSRIRVTADVFIPVGTGITHMLCNMAGGASDIVPAAVTEGIVNSLAFEVTMSGRWSAIQPTIGASADGATFTTFASGKTFYLKNLKMYFEGAILHYPMNEGIGYQLHDASSNKLDATALPTNFYHLIEKRRGYVRTPGDGLSWAGTHEAKALNGFGQRMLPDGAVIDLITRKSTAVSTGAGCTIGTTNSAARFQAAAALTGSKTVAALANQLPAGTADGDTDLLLDPDTANITATIQAEVHYKLTEGT